MKPASEQCVKAERDEWVTKWRVKKPFRHYHWSRKKQWSSRSVSSFNFTFRIQSFSLSCSFSFHSLNQFSFLIFALLVFFLFWFVHFSLLLRSMKLRDSSASIAHFTWFFLYVTNCSTPLILCALFGFQKIKINRAKWFLVCWGMHGSSLRCFEFFLAKVKS